MKTYQLVFEENFDGQGKVNPLVWNYEIGDRWPNNESQCYTDSLDHCFVKDSKLHIKASIYNQEHCKYQSAKINTYGKQHFKYGKFVVRAKMPNGKGSWPAIWFLAVSNKEQQIRWPLCGEIDLVEFAGNRFGTVSSAIHTASYNHKIGTHKGKRIELPDASDQFHDYELTWTDKELVFSVDGNPYLTVEKQANDTEKEWPFDEPYYLIINLAVGGWYGGQIDDKTFPFELEVDSIKVYQLK
ncbi:MAG: glycoside hydrolase family 16 protein [Acholeplasmataceae bacterium]|nr:glycoside hydrolase family 16 protein [Acholeplasmataceae bacterium]